MYCNKCGTYNEEDSIYCRKCGNVINEELLEEEIDNDDENNKKDKKAKNKNKTKVKKQKAKKPKKQKVKQKKPKQKVVNQGEKGMTFIQKLFMFILFILVLGLIGVLSYIGYQYYTNKDKVEVPNLIGLNYEQAESRLAEEGLKISKRTVETEDEEEDGLVIKQNKKAGKTVLEGSTIRVTIAEYENVYEVEDFAGMSIDTVRTKLNNAGIEYEIEEEYSSEYSQGFIISQNIKAGSKLKAGDEIKLTVSKGQKTDIDETTSEEDSSEETSSTVE